jgi:hypothetical protein
MENKTVRFYVEEDPITGEIVDTEIEYSFPAKFVVCYDCAGRGTTYLGWSAKEQPSFTREDFYLEGPDFEEDYFSGKYDSQCPGCKGQRVILEIEEDKIPARDIPMWEAYQNHLQAEYDYYRECEAERRMGC